MGQREEYEIKLKCPQCGEIGQATVEEAESNVFNKHPNRSLEEITDNFVWVDGGVWNTGPTFKCKKCGTQLRDGTAI